MYESDFFIYGQLPENENDKGSNKDRFFSIRPGDDKL